MGKKSNTSQSLAAAITKAAGKQTYFTIRLFVDRELVHDAYRAYGYFRWVDDMLDAQAGKKPEKIAFVKRQKELLKACYQGESSTDLCVEEQMLVDLVRNDSGKNPGLSSYLHNMMAVMEFDAGRRGQVISQAELTEYTRALATAVTDAMYYFIGHDESEPIHERCYQSVIAAHVTHMLRDTLDDIEAGYFNVPREYLQTHVISPSEVESLAYRRWVCSRVELARKNFRGGRMNLSRVKNLRRRLAGYAYTARFEWMLRIMERENYCLRAEYGERRSLFAGLWMSWNTLISMLVSPWIRTSPSNLAAQPVRIIEP